jgi:hypothetical protein
MTAPTVNFQTVACFVAQSRSIRIILAPLVKECRQVACLGLWRDRGVTTREVLAHEKVGLLEQRAGGAVRFMASCAPTYGLAHYRDSTRLQGVDAP